MAGRLKSAGRGLILAAGLFTVLLGAPRVHAESWGFIEEEYAPRIYGGDEDARVARAHFIHGDYGLAQLHYLRAVEASPQDSAAWTGLAASYDRIGRFDLAARAYRQAERHGAVRYVILNNRGYERLLRGDRNGALRLFYEAQHLAPTSPTIANNIAIAASGQGYFWTGRGGIPLPNSGRVDPLTFERPPQ
jgi:tetratricopeptide (TPR) repeat protein